MKKPKSSLRLIMTVTVIVVFTVLFLANFMNSHQELSYVVSESVSTHNPYFTKSIGKILDPTFVEGNKIDILLNGEEILPSMLNAIGSAQHTITFESYIYWSGDIGERFARMLAERARNGVMVHILLD
ncbi:MAG: hypothetical protein H7235_02100 [Bdellovibrionaceae bacterium]|nr:hypothetical protein [Pseudobdellovibrionaceae bacterium]